MSAEKVCRFCKEAPDGDRYSFIDPKGTRCSKIPCVIAFEQERDRKLRESWAQDRLQAKLKRESYHRRRQRKFRRAA